MTRVIGEQLPGGGSFQRVRSAGLNFADGVPYQRCRIWARKDQQCRAIVWI
jgi:hypothetical protein